MNLRPFLRLGLGICALTAIAAQFIDSDISYKCPENWYRHENSCYRFIKSPVRPRADAQRNCQVTFIIDLLNVSHLNEVTKQRFFSLQAYDAELLSINSMDEHRFIVHELSWQDPQHRKWYTSGKQQSPNYWINEADGSSFNDLSAIFLPEKERDQGILNRDYLAYRYYLRSFF